MADMRSPIARVRGLGSAKSGVRHWWRQRLTGAANLLLVLWFAVSAASLAGAPYRVVETWMAQPVSAVLMILLIVSLFYHLRLGLQVVIEDYVHAEGVKIASLAVISGACILLAALAILSVLLVALGG